MKVIVGTIIGAVVAWLSLPLSAQPKIALSAVDVRVSDIQAVLKTARADAADDLPIRVANAGDYNVGVYVVNRPKVAKPPAIYHETRVTEVYYCLLYTSDAADEL